MAYNWIRIDNDIGQHPRFLQIDDEYYLAAVGLHVLAIAYCDRHDTDGEIPHKAITGRTGIIAPSEHGVVDELLRVGLWIDAHHDAHRCYIIRDYLDWQRSREQKEGASVKAAHAASVRWAPKGSNAKRNASSMPDAMQRRVEKRREKTPSSSDDDAFDAFWSLYPRKVGKKDAKRRWLSAVKEVEPDTILAALKAYRFDRRDGDKFIPHPATWLNQGRWDDEVPFDEPEEKVWVVDPRSGERWRA